MGCTVLSTCIHTCNWFNNCNYHQVKEWVVFTFQLLKHVWGKKQQECIPVGRVLTAAVVTTRCQSQGGVWCHFLSGLIHKILHIFFPMFVDFFSSQWICSNTRRVSGNEVWCLRLCLKCRLRVEAFVISLILSWYLSIGNTYCLLHENSPVRFLSHNFSFPTSNF